ncbi:MAG TPA: D-alanine--D-alanine ligase [Candidatus Kapabacteria bacterium]|nr:D-alanine--D-alanine ligase [Candidatus Kapabacteria bacterium]
MRFALIYNEPKHTEPDDHWLSKSGTKLSDDFRDASEFGVLEEIEGIARALREGGHTVTIFSVDDDVERLVSFLEAERPEAIFNLCEAVLGRADLEMCVAGVYDLFGIPYTGAGTLALGISLNKSVSKAIFAANDIPTPAFAVVEPGNEVPSSLSLNYPLIVKPVREDASIGIDNNSIVGNKTELTSRVTFVHTEFKQPALIEEYIDGRELNVAVIADKNGSFQTLPISEITFDSMPAGSPRIVSYEAKWVEESPLYKTTIPVCPADLDETIAAEARRIALKSANVVGLQDYGRIDMRLRDDGSLFVLEANPNPDISLDAGFMRACFTSGLTHSQAINLIASCAAVRKSK